MVMQWKNIIAILIVFIVNAGFAGFEKEFCHNYLQHDYITDEQEYIARYNENSQAFFHATFYKSTTYRIVVCSKSGERVKFTLSDKYDNIIFCSENFNYADHWDFYFENTMDCNITVEKIGTGNNEIRETAMLLIGFKK